MKFKIAEHVVELLLDEQYHHVLAPYKPFQCDDELDSLYSVSVVESIDYQLTKTLLEDVDLSSEGMVRVNVYETTEGLLYNIIMPRSSVVDGQLHIVGDCATLCLNRDAESNYFREAAFTNAMILSYMSFAMPHYTLLFHASTVMKDGSAYLFLGKSGTGKSTHSNMWLESYSDAELLNDDHPIVRFYPDGSVIAYGSPWSGKRPCYRNESAPLRAIVRIKRAEYNKLTKLSTLKSYASVTTSISGVQWCKELLAAKAKALEAIITHCGCYQMECLPNNDAAHCCYESLCAEEL